MLEERRERKPVNLVTWIPLVLTIAAMIWAGATSLQSKFDTLDKRQERIEDKLDTFMNAFNVEYAPKTAQAIPDGLSGDGDKQ